MAAVASSLLLQPSWACKLSTPGMASRRWHPLHPSASSGLFFLAGGRGWGCICISHCMPVECFNKLRTESIIGPRRPVKCLGRLGFFFLSNFGALECSLEQLGEYICAAVL
jgi:hypothetical protein